MSSPDQEREKTPSDAVEMNNGSGGSGADSASAERELRAPSKRRLSSTVIEISDTESDDSDVCAVNSYQASADEVKRIRGEEYSSSSSSSSDYSSDSESPWEDDSVLVEDDKVDVKVVKAKLNPRANRMDEPKLNPTLKSEELIKNLSMHWKDSKDFTNSDVTLTCDPFRVCLLHGLLGNPEIINNIVDDMNTLDWSRKKMDLYEFQQTMDLASLTWQRSIRGIYDLLKNELMPWVSAVTGLQLSSVSASCSLYGPGDHLLVHDDLLADRRVAFILYLAPWGRDHATGRGQQEAEWGGWTEAMGGALELLARDERGPSHVVRRVAPRNNMLALFRVSNHSYHQVGEVLSMELPRLSINGWFHGPAPEDEPPPRPESPPPPPELLPPHTDVVLVNQWVESTYMSARARAQVQAQMERDSEVCLAEFLQATQRERLAAALADPSTPWERAGPADRRRYERVPLARLPPDGALAELCRLLTAAPFFRLLADCTDLALAHHCALEVQRWTPGSYTLLPPRELYQQPRLEALLHVCGAGRGGGGGGATTYVAPDDADGALVTLAPRDNALALVYCDVGAAAFTKHVSRLAAHAQPFYIVTCQYREAV